MKTYKKAKECPLHIKFETNHTKHLKNSNAACFYTPVIVLQLLIIDQMQKTAWRRKLNHNNFDTSFVKIDQVLIIIWHLKGEKYPFPLLQ